MIGSEETIMLERNAPPAPQRDPWNKGRLIGQKRPLKPKDVWPIGVAISLTPNTSPTFVAATTANLVSGAA